MALGALFDIGSRVVALDVGEVVLGSRPVIIQSQSLQKLPFIFELLLVFIHAAFLSSRGSFVLHVIYVELSYLLLRALCCLFKLSLGQKYLAAEQVLGHGSVLKLMLESL